MDIERLRAFEPAIIAGYERHTQHDNRPQNPTGPLNHHEVLQNASGTRGQEWGDTVDAIRQSTLEHEARLEELELDFRPIKRSSTFVNLLTEDNLPYYHAALGEAAILSEPFMRWRNRWTAEEARHSLIIHGHAVAAGVIASNEYALIPDDEYSDALASQHINGMGIEVSEPESAFVYLAIQEKATLVSHRRQLALEDITGIKSKKYVAGDEKNHTIFYSGLAKESVQIDPNRALVASAKTVLSFAMPGKIGIPGFEQHADVIALAGIFDTKAIDDIVQDFIKDWGLLEVSVTTEEAKKAQERLSKPTPFSRIQRTIDTKREALIADYKQNGGLVPVILGQTVELKGTELVRKDF